MMMHFISVFVSTTTTTTTTTTTIIIITTTTTTTTTTSSSSSLDDDNNAIISTVTLLVSSETTTAVIPPPIDGICIVICFRICIPLYKLYCDLYWDISFHSIELGSVSGFVLGLSFDIEIHIFI